MVSINIYNNRNKEIMGFRTEGHANFAPNGSDVVCAAVSVLAINTTNAIEKFTKDSFSRLSNEDDGIIDFQLKRTPSKEAHLLLKAMELGLQDMEKDYKKYIKISYEEV